jgi:hypothetical protein
LKNGGPNLVDALYEVIQQAWTSETLPRRWKEGVLCPVYKKGDFDCKNYRGNCLLNVTYNRQGLRQGDVLSTLLFNVVLEVIVRRATLQTTGTIFNKETQLHAYADDIDIFGRSQSAIRDAYLVLEREAAKVGLKINE